MTSEWCGFSIDQPNAAGESASMELCGGLRAALRSAKREGKMPNLDTSDILKKSRERARTRA
tara:strand:+ start:285 stop:470 length:186 start_codon:yes stop_codon:yes gene_type:complete